jgi:hypothetical protein
MKTRTKEFFEGRHLGLMATIIFFAWLGFGIFGQCAGGGDMIKALRLTDTFLSAHAKKSAESHLSSG